MILWKNIHQIFTTSIAKWERKVTVGILYEVWALKKEDWFMEDRKDGQSDNCKLFFPNNAEKSWAITVCFLTCIRIKTLRFLLLKFWLEMFDLGNFFFTIFIREIRQKINFSHHFSVEIFLFFLVWHFLCVLKKILQCFLFTKCCNWRIKCK